MQVTAYIFNNLAALDHLPSARSEIAILFAVMWVGSQQMLAHS